MGMLENKCDGQILIFGLMLHSICSWFSRMWMKDSYLVALLILGRWWKWKGEDWYQNVQRSVSCSSIWTMCSGELHSGLNWSCELKLWVAEIFYPVPNVRYVISVVGIKKKLALQVSIEEWWNG
jgi:hypothetical protein